MSRGGTQLAQTWEKLTGSDAAHSARLIRALMLSGQFPIGRQGRAAHLNAVALTNFLLADMTGDGISTASDRATLWSGLICSHGALLGADIAGVLDCISNDSPEVLSQYSRYPTLKIELFMGGIEGPQAFLQRSSRCERYSMKAKPSHGPRSIGVPKQRVTFIQAGHLTALASLLAETGGH